VAVAGLGVGWLVGLSLSPVIATVLTSILGIATGVVAGLTVLDLEKPKLSTIPGRSRSWSSASPSVRRSELWRGPMISSGQRLSTGAPTR
jgi:hypothetical protein